MPFRQSSSRLWRPEAKEQEVQLWKAGQATEAAVYPDSGKPFLSAIARQYHNRRANGRIHNRQSCSMLLSWQCRPKKGFPYLPWRTDFPHTTAFLFPDKGKNKFHSPDPENHHLFPDIRPNIQYTGRREALSYNFFPRKIQFRPHLILRFQLNYPVCFSGWLSCSPPE